MPGKKAYATEYPIDPRWQRSKFTELRYEYYAAGRTLWFTDQMEMGALLLGYAIECSLKLALVESGETEEKLLKSHCYLDLYRRCKERQALVGVEASEDLLQYISDAFNQRYPSQVMSTGLRANQRGHAISQNIKAIWAYDDLMMQLDHALVMLAKEESIRVGLMAARFCNRPQGRAIFHNNIAALKEHARYLYILKEEFAISEVEQRASGRNEDTIRFNMARRKACIDVWEKAPAALWKADHLQCSADQFEESEYLHIARDFSYPGKHKNFV